LTSGKYLSTNTERLISRVPSRLAPLKSQLRIPEHAIVQVPSIVICPPPSTQSSPDICTLPLRVAPCITRLSRISPSFASAPATTEFINFTAPSARKERPENSDRFRFPCISVVSSQSAFRGG